MVAICDDESVHIEKIRTILSDYETDNYLSPVALLDALLEDKYHTARRYKIFVEFVKVNYHIDLDSSDLCTVIGNLFDNAIAENLKTSHTDDRRISISIRTTEEELIVEIRNPLFHELKIKNDLPASDKPNLEHHGISLKKVR